MAKLSGQIICDAVKSGAIIIDPFDPERVGPNSYDLTLGSQIKSYNLFHQSPYSSTNIRPLDVKTDNPIVEKEIGDSGFVLQPNTLYLAHTNEVAGSKHYVPCIEGRSSMARLGIQVHLTAGFGDVGFVGQWTLEILVVHPVRVYVGTRICQIYFDTLIGQIDKLYEGKYNNSKGAIASRSWEDFNG